VKCGPVRQTSSVPSCSGSIQARHVLLSSWELTHMLYYALVFLIVGLIAGVLGVSGVAGVATQIAYVLFVIAIVLFIVHLITGRSRPVL